MKRLRYKEGSKAPDGQSPRLPTPRPQPDRYQLLKRMAFFVYFLATVLYLSAPVWSAAIRGRDNGPVVTVKNGSYSGIHSAEYGQDFFLGMPYAKVGGCNLELMATY